MMMVVDGIFDFDLCHSESVDDVDVGEELEVSKVVVILLVLD